MKNYKNVTTVILSSLIIAACGGGGGSDVNKDSNVPAGFWEGKSENMGISGLVLKDGTYYFSYTKENSNDISGMVLGSLNSKSSYSTSDDGVDLNFETLEVKKVSIMGDVSDKNYFSGQFTYNKLLLKPFSMVYNNDYEKKADLDNIVGRYYDNNVSNVDNDVNIEPNGKFTVTYVNGCVVNGTFEPRQDENVYNVTFNINSPSCGVENTVIVKGVSYFNSKTGTMYSFGRSIDAYYPFMSVWVKK